MIRNEGEHFSKAFGPVISTGSHHFKQTPVTQHLQFKFEYCADERHWHFWDYGHAAHTEHPNYYERGWQRPIPFCWEEAS